MIILKLRIKTNCILLMQLVFILFTPAKIHSQGLNSTFLLGYSTNPNINKARINFTDTTYTILPELRKIRFIDTQGNISDANGNLLMSSNGVFIADATGDTMLNGGGLNPNQFTIDYSLYGLFLPYGNIFLPHPSDTTKYFLFHQTGTYNNPYLTPEETFYSEIDITLNNGKGEVINKNDTLLSAMFGAGLTACKHGNGRDWWIIALSDSAKIAYKFLLTPDTIQLIGTQNLPIPGCFGFSGQPTFSPDGEKFAFVTSNGNLGFWTSRVQLFDFDRCDGNFTLDTVIDFTDGNTGIGTAFSSNSKYLYFSTLEHIYQIDCDTSNIGATYQLVATNDTFLSSPPFIYTNFAYMYLSANGKIYITSTSSVLHLHEMDYPDSAGTACTLNLHNTYTAFFFIGVPNHPNYYLGRKIGSPCDSLTSVSETEHNFHFNFYPNPNNGNFSIKYLLPQNKKGKLEIFDLNGTKLFSYSLPQWSTLQNFSIPNLAAGVYVAKINSDNISVSRKLIVFK